MSRSGGERRKIRPFDWHWCVLCKFFFTVSDIVKNNSFPVFIPGEEGKNSGTMQNIPKKTGLLPFIKQQTFFT